MAADGTNQGAVEAIGLWGIGQGVCWETWRGHKGGHWQYSKTVPKRSILKKSNSH